MIAGLHVMMEDDVGNHKRNAFSLKPAHEVVASKLESSKGRELERKPHNRRKRNSDQ